MKKDVKSFKVKLLRDLREDLYLSLLAAARDTPAAAWVSHEEAWKNIHE